jgi:hypothetical protein
MFIFNLGKYLWLRATGSTFVSQILDSFVVSYVGKIYIYIYTYIYIYICMGIRICIYRISCAYITIYFMLLKIHFNTYFNIHVCFLILICGLLCSLFPGQKFDWTNTSHAAWNHKYRIDRYTCIYTYMYICIYVYIYIYIYIYMYENKHIYTYIEMYI